MSGGAMVMPFLNFTKCRAELLMLEPQSGAPG